MMEGFCQRRYAMLRLRLIYTRDTREAREALSDVLPRYSRLFAQQYVAVFSPFAAEAPEACPRVRSRKCLPLIHERYMRRYRELVMRWLRHCASFGSMRRHCGYMRVHTSAYFFAVRHFVTYRLHFLPSFLFLSSTTIHFHHFFVDDYASRLPSSLSHEFSIC